jgi:hypothetical protein
LQNIIYGVLYAYTPEVFLAPSRGTGTGISSFLNRVAGLSASITAANIPDANPNAPVFVSGSLILAAFVAVDPREANIMIGSIRNTRIEDDNQILLVLDTLQYRALFPSRVLWIS